MEKPLVGIIMGSQSDLDVMAKAADALDEFGIPYELNVLSAHRTPELTVEYAKNARANGLKVIIAAAGGAAHLAGVVAALTTLPVIAVPIRSANSLDGWDSLLSMVQMPEGIPVATVAVNGSKNAGILAAQIIGVSDAAVAQKLGNFKQSLKKKIEDVRADISKRGFRAVLSQSKSKESNGKTTRS